MRISHFSHIRFFITLSCLVIGMIFIGLSLRETGDDTRTEKTLWIVDNSMSMQVEDMRENSTNTYYSRLQVARSLISSGVMMIPGQHAIVTYARSPGVLIPFTSDTTNLLSIVRNISPVMENGGSDIGAALTLVSSLYASPEERLRIVLLTDGGESGTGSYPSLGENMELSIIGIGSDSGGPITLGYDASGQRRYKIYQGKEIHVAYEKKNIEKLQSLYNAHVQVLSEFPENPVISYLLPISPVHKDSMHISWYEGIGVVFVLFGLFFSPYVSSSRK